MNFLSLILSSGIFDSPYIFEICCCWFVILVCLFFVIFTFLKDDALDSLSCEALILLLLSVSGAALIAMGNLGYYVDKGKEENKKVINILLYDNHEYIIYDNQDILHNPNCPCRKDSSKNHGDFTVRPISSDSVSYYLIKYGSLNQ